MIATVPFDLRLLPEYRDEHVPTVVIVPVDARPVVAAPRARDLVAGADTASRAA